MPVAADLYYQLFEGSQEGQRPPVVLLHGAGGTHLYWPSEVRRLVGYRIYALDLPGHGKSSGYGQQTIQSYAGAILDWLVAVRIHAAVFIGHSMGSAIALTLALDSPGQVLGLGLVGAGARLNVNPVLLESVSSEATYPTAIEAVVKWSFGRQTAAALVALAARRMGETRPSVLYGDFLACDAFDVSERLGEVRQPTLILSGEEDRMTPRRNAQYMADKIPGAMLRIIPQAGHMVMLEQPLVVSAALSEFLATIPY
jgi:pimeloyl-ACP methyl ester carboxylesterase